MRFKGTGTLMTVAVLWAGGCAHSDFPLSRNGQTRWGPVDQRAILEAKDVVPPKILPQTYYAAAQLLEKQGQVLPAIAQYRKAIAVNHEYVAAYDRLGVLLGKVGMYPEATETLRQAAKLAPDNASIHNNLGFQLVLNGEWSDAEREFDRAIELVPGFSRAHINRGVVMGKAGRYDEALSSFLAVLPEADAFYNLGIIYRTQEKYEQAAEAFHNTLAADPEFASARRQLDVIAEHLAPPTAPPAVAVASADSDAVMAPVTQPQKPTLTAQVLPPVETPTAPEPRGLEPTARTVRHRPIVESVTTVPAEKPSRGTAPIEPERAPATPPVSRADRPTEMTPITPGIQTGRDTDIADDIAPSSVAFADGPPAPKGTSTSDVSTSTLEPCEDTLIIEQSAHAPVDYAIINSPVTVAPEETIATMQELQAKLTTVREEINCLTKTAAEQETQSAVHHRPLADGSKQPVGGDRVEHRVTQRPTASARAGSTSTAEVSRKQTDATVMLPMTLLEDSQGAPRACPSATGDKAILTRKTWSAPAKSSKTEGRHERTAVRTQPSPEPAFEELNDRASVVDNEVRCLETRGFENTTEGMGFSGITSRGELPPSVTFDEMVEIVTNEAAIVDQGSTGNEESEAISYVEEAQPADTEPSPMYEIRDDQ